MRNFATRRVSCVAHINEMPEQQQQSLLVETLGVMVNVVGMMYLGAWLQMTGRLDKDSSRGLSAFVGTIALPALFFKALAEENLFKADPIIVAALILSKSVMVTVSASSVASGPQCALSTRRDSASSAVVCLRC